MIEIRGIHEVAVKVANLERAEEFYCGVLGLEVGLRDESRRWTFLRAGGSGGMVVLQEDRGSWPQQHFAFTVAAESIDGAAAELHSRGVRLDGLMTHDWIPARSLYFADPDGHDVELLAPLPRAGN